MIIASLNCPYERCGSFATFKQIGWSPMRDDSVGLAHAMHAIACRCPACGGLISVEVELPETRVEYLRQGQHRLEELLQGLNSTRFRVFPKASAPVAPIGTPAAVAAHYLEAKNSLRAQIPGGAAMTARATLEAATTDLMGDNAGGNLYKRIEWLEENGKITELLSEWAHELRLDGNAAAHADGPITQAVAEEIVSFAEVFLTYVYELPARIKERQAQRDKRKDAQGELNE